MKRLSLQKKFILALVSFTVIILLLWFGCYIMIYNSLTAAAEGEAQIPGRTVFLVISILIPAIFIIATAILYRYLSNSMVKPMTSVIGGVASLDGELSGRLHELPVAGKPDFETLVLAVNRMLDRTEQFSNELLDERQKLFDAEILQRDMQIGLLTSQIDAHFVVNTITSIHTLSSQGDNERAGQVAYGLAQIIKHRHSGDELRNLFIELEMVKAYITIMNIRYNDRFTAEYDVDDELVEYLIPGLVLQPIVENALTHGLQSEETGMLLIICGHIEENAIIIEVFDNGVGIEHTKLESIKDALERKEIGNFPDPGLSGIALSNIHKRIRLWFGDSYGLSIDSDPNKGATVTIKLPAIMERR